jgi:hypothetical protein
VIATVPAGEAVPADAVTTATSVTSWFVAALLVVGVSVVELAVVIKPTALDDLLAVAPLPSSAVSTTLMYFPTSPATGV